VNRHVNGGEFRKKLEGLGVGPGSWRTSRDALGDRGAKAASVGVERNGVVPDTETRLEIAIVGQKRRRTAALRAWVSRNLRDPKESSPQTKEIPRQRKVDGVFQRKKKRSSTPHFSNLQQFSEVIVWVDRLSPNCPVSGTPLGGG